MLNCHRECQEGVALAGKNRPLAKQQVTLLGLQKAITGRQLVVTAVTHGCTLSTPAAVLHQTPCNNPDSS